MRGLLWCGLFCCCLLVAGCAEYQARLAAQHAAEDDAKCQSYGAKQGDPAYVQCRAQLDAARTQADATESAAVIDRPTHTYNSSPPPTYRLPTDSRGLPCVGVGCR
jgi:hypothetical protein